MLTWHPRLQLVGRDGLTLLALHSKHAAANSTCCFVSAVSGLLQPAAKS